MQGNHNITLENRKLLNISGITEVESSDDTVVKLKTLMGKLIIIGSDLAIEKINVDTGEFSMKGTVKKLEYKNNSTTGKFSSMFK